MVSKRANINYFYGDIGNFINKFWNEGNNQKWYRNISGTQIMSETTVKTLETPNLTILFQGDVGFSVNNCKLARAVKNRERCTCAP